MTKHLSFTLVILVMAVLEATRPAYADEDYFVPLQLHYVNGDRNGESINVQDLIGNVWQLREIITTFDDRDGYPPIAEVRVVLGEASAVQQALQQALAPGQNGFYIRDESIPSTLNQLEHYVDDSVLNF